MSTHPLPVNSVKWIAPHYGVDRPQFDPLPPLLLFVGPPLMLMLLPL